MLDQKHFYSVFTGPSKAAERQTSRYRPELNDLIVNCSSSVPLTIDREMVESERQFLPFSSNPLLIETMASDIFTALTVLEYDPDLYCFIVGTSKI